MYAAVRSFDRQVAINRSPVQIQQNSRRYQTSPALCTPITTSRPICHIACAQNFPDFYVRLPDILNDPFCCMTLLATFAANAVLTATAKVANAFEWPGQLPKIVPFPWDFVTLPEATCTEKFVKISCVVPEICSRTRRQTHSE